MILIDENGQMLGRVSRDQALYLAYEKGFDLVMINGNVNPPVTKLMDYGKYHYNQTKQLSKQRAKARDVEIKEIRLSIKISDHDLEVKLNQARKFLDEGHKVKVTVQLKGREMIFRDKVNGFMEKVRLSLGGKQEKPIERMGSRFSTIIAKANNEN